MKINIEMMCTCRVCEKSFQANKIFDEEKMKKPWDAEWQAEAQKIFNICDECCAEERYEDCELEDYHSLEDAKINGYPELSGDAKKVAWATTIRGSFINHYIWWAGYMDIAKQLMSENVKKIVNSETTADFWIANRHNHPSDIFGEKR